HTRFSRDWSSDVCSSDLEDQQIKEYPGTYAEYCVWMEDRIAQITEQPEPRKKVESKENKPSRTPDESKIKRNQLQKKAEELEAEIGRASCREREKMTVFG